MCVHLKHRDGNREFRTEPMKLAAYEVIPSFWSSHSAGMINHQIPRAAVNPGSLLKILLVAACCNAASVHVQPSIPLSTYFSEIAAQLGLPVNPQVREALIREGRFQAVSVPRFIFPGTELPTQWNGLIGLATCRRNLEKFDLRLALMNSLEVKCEAKERCDLSTNSLGKAARKLITGSCSIGLLVVGGCCNYWTSGAQLTKNLANIQSVMRLFPKRRLGKVILISESCQVRVESFGSGEGRLVVMQVPGDVLGHG